MIRVGTAVTAMLLLLMGPATAAVAGPKWDALAEDSSVGINARDAHAAVRAASGQDPDAALEQYLVANLCDTSSPELSSPVNGPCPPGDAVVGAPECEVGAAVAPVWRRTRATPADGWSPWQFVTGWACPEDVIPALSVEEFRRLPLVPSTLRVQPERPTVLVNMPTITMTDPVPQQLTTTLLGYPVEVLATPESFTWDYGDGSEALTTTSPGHPYPDHDVAHPYAAPGTYVITLTTTWRGQYRLAGTDTWHDVDGTATTTTTSAPITAEERRAHLVAEPCTPTTC